MGLFDKENPIIHPLRAHQRESLESTLEIVRSNIRDAGACQPDLISTPLTYCHQRRGEACYVHLFIARWQLPSLPEPVVGALEDLTAYTYAPSLTQGRRNPLGQKMPPSKVPGVAGGYSQRYVGYLLKDWGYRERTSPGIWIYRTFPNRSAAHRGIKQRDWIHTGPAAVEVRVAEGISQLAFAETVVQVGHIVQHARPLPYDRLLYKIYRDLSRIGIREKSQEEIAGLDETLDFMKWTLFAASKNEKAAAHFQCRPESILLAGVKGTGKTLIAEVLASMDHNSLFVPVSAIELVREKYESKGGSDEEEPGETLFSAVQNLQTRTNARVCLHCDDIESALLSTEDAESEQRLATNSTLLNKLSGIRQSRNMTLTGATNDPYLIDERFLRFGRIGYFLHVPLPNVQTRDAILAIHTRKMPLAVDVNLHSLAEQTDSYTSAALVEIANRAGLCALKRCAAEKAREHDLKDPFDALPTLAAEDLDGKRVAADDFHDALMTVGHFERPAQNKMLDERIRRFCESFNQRQSIGF